VRAVLITLLVLIIGLGAVAGGIWAEYQRFLSTPIPVADAQEIIEIPVGTGLRQLARELSARGWIANPWFFIALAYEREAQRSIKAGEYAVTPGMRPPEMLALFVSGRSIEFPVSIIEGHTFHDAVATVAGAGPFKIELADLDEAGIMARLGIDAEHPEGWLFPDTYRFPRHTTDTRILRRAHARMQQVLAEEWEQRQPGLPYASPYEALIMASIIEKETGAPHERAAIAGVFVRRLQKGMRLQTDPTVIYGLGDDFDGTIRRSDLDRPTPYNTYVIFGLPPTPIALPGRAAIHAALNPADGDTLYFVSRRDGTHHFSATLAEHNCAVRHYLRGRPCAELVEQP